MVKRRHLLSSNTKYEKITEGKDVNFDGYRIKTSDIITPLTWLVHSQADDQGYYDTGSIKYLHLMWTEYEKTPNDEGGFANLFEINFRDSYFRKLEGVYIIWNEGITPQVIRVGQGVIRTRLQAHRKESYTIKLKDQGVFSTWAILPKEFRDGVEKFLSLILLPDSGDRFPKTKPIEVNLPCWKEHARTRLCRHHSE